MVIYHCYRMQLTPNLSIPEKFGRAWEVFSGYIEYVVMEKPVPHRVAIEACKFNGGNLATVRNREQSRFIAGNDIRFIIETAS